MDYGRYRVIEEIGHGNIGVVYRAHDPVIGRQVAVKVVRDFAWLTPEQREAFDARFRAEAEAAGSLHHSHIVTLYDVGDGYLVMEFVDGQTLASLLRSRQPLPLPQVLEIASQVAEALDFAHSKGVVHRELKPANIMVLPSGGVKVLDFGVARPRKRDSESAPPVLGSAAYMAPEQLLGQRAEGPADIFSLGVIVFELLAGERPFAGTSEAAIIEQIKTAPPASLLKINPALPSAYDPVVLKALEKEPARRYDTAGRFVAALYEASIAVPDVVVVYPAPRAAPEAPPPPVTTVPALPERPFEVPARLRPRLALGAAAGVLLLLLAWLATSRGGSRPASPPPPVSAPPRAAASPEPRTPPPDRTAAAETATPSHALGAGRGGKTVLLVTTEPAGARIFVGGVEKGQAPLTLIDPEAGPTVVRAEKEGYHPAARLAIITPGHSVGVPVMLSPLSATPTDVDVLSMPDAGTLSIDGVVVGKTNAGISLTPGVHVVEVRKEGFDPWIQEIEVGSQRFRIIATLEKKAGVR